MTLSCEQTIHQTNYQSKMSEASGNWMSDSDSGSRYVPDADGIDIVDYEGGEHLYDNVPDDRSVTDVLEFESSPLSSPALSETKDDPFWAPYPRWYRENEPEIRAEYNRRISERNNHPLNPFSFLNFTNLGPLPGPTPGFLGPVPRPPPEDEITLDKVGREEYIRIIKAMEDAEEKARIRTEENRRRRLAGGAPDFFTRTPPDENLPLWL